MDKGYDVIPKSKHPADVESFVTEMEELEIELALFAKKEIVGLAIFAHFYGWRRANAKGLVMAAPDGGKTINLPTSASGINARVFRSTANTIVRHGVRTTNMPPYELVDGIVTKGKLNHDQARALRQAVDGRNVPLPVEVGVGLNDEGMPDFEGAAPTPKAPAIVRLEPWTAHGRTRKDKGTETYPSEAVMEVTWSDGTTSYSCRAEDCEFESEFPRSVANHFASKHRRGQGTAPQPEADGLDNDWTPTQATRIRRLKRELDGALAAGIDLTDTEAIAAWIITHRIEGLPGTEGGDGDTSVPAEPLTAEQILDKIAALADRGRAHILREQLNSLNGLLDASEAAREEEARRRQKAEGNLTALRELINETGE